eukprot:1210687-Prorocentrum_lima.AAC.1
MPQVLSLSLQLQRALSPEASDAELFLPVLTDILQQSGEQKGKYSMLKTILVNMSSVTDVCEKLPTFIDSMMRAIGPSQHTASTVAELI